MEGEGLSLGVLGIDGHHGNVGERTVMPRKAKYTYSSSILFLCILMVMQNKLQCYLLGQSMTSSGLCLTSYNV